MNYGRFPVELLIWLFGLSVLFFIDLNANGHMTFCIFNFWGIDFCPGCGLGRSIALIFNGNIHESFRAHPLGLIALIIIGYRILTLSYKMINGRYLFSGGNHG